MTSLARLASILAKRLAQNRISTPPIKSNFLLANGQFFGRSYAAQSKPPQKQRKPEPKAAVAKDEKKPPKIAEADNDDGKIEDAKVTVSTTLGPTIISSVTQMDSTKQQEEQQKRQENSWQTMKMTFTLFGVSFTCMGLFLAMELGRPKIDDDGEVLEDEYSGMPVVQQYFYRIIDQINYYRKLINEPSREKLLPDVLKYPYHQPPYTLILELKDVLVHPDWTYNTGWRFKKRPGIDQFLETLNGIYEIVIYTAELGMTVFPIMEALDPNNLIAYKLVRDATNFVNGVHVKDLDKLNRDLSKVVVVDWDKDAIQFHRDNVLQISRWDGDDGDTTLIDLANFLRVIAISDIADVREVLRYYKEFDDPIATFKEKQRELELAMYRSGAKS